VYSVIIFICTFYLYFLYDFILNIFQFCALRIASITSTVVHALLTHLMPPPCTRFCTSVTLKSSFKIATHSEQNQKVSSLHITCSQQVSDQLNISSACTVYISLDVSLFIVFLQRVSIACYAERCISYDRFCLTV